MAIYQHKHLKLDPDQEAAVAAKMAEHGLGLNDFYELELALEAIGVELPAVEPDAGPAQTDPHQLNLGLGGLEGKRP